GGLGWHREIGTTGRLTENRPPTRTVLEGRTIYIPDGSDPVLHAEYPDSQNRSAHAVIHVPLMHEHGAIGLLRAARPAARGYSAREIALMETFADQAVIAIENARLFQELNDSNANLREALEQQTATAEVLRVIASSPTDLRAVLQAILEAAARLCDAPGGTI